MIAHFRTKSLKCAKLEGMVCAKLIVKVNGGLILLGGVFNGTILWAGKGARPGGHIGGSEGLP